jgi:cell division protease FtsH
MNALQPGRGGHWLLLAVVFATLLLQWVRQAGPAPEEVSYTHFEQALAQGRVERVVIGDSRMTGYLKSPGPGAARTIVTDRVEPELAERLSRFSVPYAREHGNSFLQQLLSWVLPMALLFGVWYFLMGRFAGHDPAGGMMAIGKSHAKVLLERSTGVTFADVAGVDEAKEELREVVDFLRDPQRYGRLGARIPKGVLLVGPPGTGKTLLARALAGEAGVTFLSTNGAEFVEMFVGVGAARVRDLFDQARHSAPAIIFIDELDALGRARGAYGIGGIDEKEQTLNQLLAEMDGFDPSVGVIILAATNRPEILDPALLRAGRFDRQVLVDRPDLKGRIDVLKVHANRVHLGPDVRLEEVAALTPGFAGADLANVVNEAALLATRRGAEAVTMSDFNSAIERIVAGLEKKTRVLSARERRVVAFHEMGHALVAMALTGVDPVHKVSIIPRGIAGLGYTIQRPTEDRYLMSREEIAARLAVLLGGRAAEMLVFQSPSTGAADDLVKATALARAVVARYGMDESLGLVAYEEDHHALLPSGPPSALERRYSEESAHRIDQAVHDTLRLAYQAAFDLLRQMRPLLERSAERLLEKETLGRSELATLEAEVRAGLREAAGLPSAVPEG